MANTNANNIVNDVDALNIDIQNHDSFKIKKKYNKKRKLKKEAILLAFNPEYILELKRQLFNAGLTCHQFFGYILLRLIDNDPRLQDLLQEAKNYKKQRILEGKEEKIDAETMYNLIEEKLTEIT